MSKTTNSTHNQVIISISTPHVQMPGIQILRPEEIKVLAEKEQRDQRSQKIEGKYIDIIKYDFIVKKEDIEAGVLGNTPENPKKNKDKRPMSANIRVFKEKNKKDKLAMTSNNFQTKKLIEKTKKNVKNVNPEENNEENKEELEEEEENMDINEEKNEEKSKKTTKVEKNSNKNQIEDETFENVQNQENELTIEENNQEFPESDKEIVEIEEQEEEIDENLEGKSEPEEEKTVFIEKKPNNYQSNMANVKKK